MQQAIKSTIILCRFSNLAESNFYYMILRTYSLILITLIVTQTNLLAQVIKTNSVSVKVEADYRKDEPIVLERILWLEENPISTATNDTKAMTEFVLDWLSNTPYITVTYDEVFLDGISNPKYKFIEKFRVTYLFGKSHYVITHVEEPDEVAASARGIEGMVKVYKELKRMDPSAKHRQLEKYSRLVKSDKLDTYVRNKLMSQDIEEEPYPEPYQ